MLSSITPLGERGRQNRWALTAAAYVVGSTLGGAAVGLALGITGAVLADPLPGSVRLGALAVVGFLGVAADLGVGGLAVPTIKRQVDEGWIGRYRGWVYGAGYGAQLGVGAVTIVTSAATWVALAAALLTGTWWGGLAVGAAFGLTRSLPLLLAASASHPAALRDLHVRNEAWAPRARRLAVSGQGVAAGAAVLLAIAAIGAPT